jgi:hypothetical protein
VLLVLVPANQADGKEVVLAPISSWTRLSIGWGRRGGDLRWAAAASAVTPAHAAGVVDDAVTTPGGTGTRSGPLYLWDAAGRHVDRAHQRPDPGRYTDAHFTGDLRRGDSDGQEAVNATTIRRWGRRTQPELSMSR